MCSCASPVCVRVTDRLLLKVSEPEKWVDAMQEAGADVFTFHIEAVKNRGRDVGEMIQQVKDAQMKVGIALKPNTPASEVEPYLGLVDLVRATCDEDLLLRVAGSSFDSTVRLTCARCRVCTSTASCWQDIGHDS